MKFKKQTLNGFTLAEVLITLGIIGIVAALTIPTIMNATQDMEFKTAYKKAYSALSQAFTTVQSNGDLVPLLDASSSQGGEAEFSALKKQFHIAKSCDTSNLSDCWASGEKFRYEAEDVPSFIDASGTAWRLRCPDYYYVSTVVLVDVNGNKKPNEYGKDRFALLFATQDKNTWDDNDMGIPTRVIPFPDVLDNSMDTCPSASKHPCYYASWLYR